MKVSYRWLLDYVDCPWEPEELASRLTMSGLKVENLERPGSGMQGIVTARVERVVAHPNADVLYVVEIATGSSRATVVTGATNVRPGDVVPYAPPGSQLPDGRVLQLTELRGVASEGMLCSEAELGLGDDEAGIMILPPDAPVGQSLSDLLGLDDWVLEFEIYPNRPDCQGVIGIAREVAALCRRPLKLPPADYRAEGPPAGEWTRVDIEDEALCRRYIAHLTDGVKVAPSPLWLQQRVRAAGMRPISNVVDITNFVMLEWGQPLHAFDFRTLEEERIVVRRARAGETLITLDGRERRLEPDMLVIADGRRPVALAGIMGGAETEVTESTDTLLLEAAHFQPVTVRRTARRLGIRTEASHRFEKGLDPELPMTAARRALHLLQDLAGARIFQGAVDQYPRPVTRRVVYLRPERVNRFLGIQLSAEEMADTLRRLEFTVRPAQASTAEESGGGEGAAGGELEVEVPSFRQDVEREVDLAEEIVRLYGFDRVPAVLPQAAAEAGGQNRILRGIDLCREVLVGMGFSEAINYSFVSPRHDDALLLPADHPWRRHVVLRNPLSEEQSVMRTQLLGGLLEAAARNRARRVQAVHLFEIGAVFHPAADPGQQPAEPRRLGLLMAGPLPERTWGLPARSADFFALKGAVEELAAALGRSLVFRASRHPSLHPGRQAEIYAGDVYVGIMGEVHPRVLEAFEAPKGTCVAELDLDRLVATFGEVARFRSLPRYPVVRRDLALLVPKKVPAASVEELIRRSGGELLAELNLFDVYEGKQVPEGFRSVAYALGFRSDTRTLTDEEVNEAMARLEAVLAEEAGVRVRR